MSWTSIRPQTWIGLASAATLCLAVYVFRDVLWTLGASLLIAYVLDPIVSWLQKKGIGRAWGLTITLTILALLLAAFAFWILPLIVRDVLSFASTLPADAQRFYQTWQPKLRRYGVTLPRNFSELARIYTSEWNSAAMDSVGRVTVMGTWLLTTVISTAGTLVAVLFVPMFACYLLYSFPEFKRVCITLVPPRFRDNFLDVVGELDHVLSGFIRGQLLVMTLLGVLYAGGYAIVGVPLALPIGLIGGIVAFIPYLGSATALVLALLMCVLHWQGWGSILAATAVYVVVQVLEGFVITPKIMGNQLGLSSVWVLIALLVGGEYFGLMGVLLALPVAAACRVFVRRGYVWYKRSSFYREGVAG